jgi:hypothetical protein
VTRARRVRSRTRVHIYVFRGREVVRYYAMISLSVTLNAISVGRDLPPAPESESFRHEWTNGNFCIGSGRSVSAY